MVNVQPGYVVVEHDLLSRAVRSYFSDEPVPPVEEYREGKHIWQYAGTAQSFQFDVRDDETGEIIPFRELLGLMYYGCAQPESDISPHRGDRPREQHLHLRGDDLRVAGGSPGQHLPGEDRDPEPTFNERLRSRGKKILILPDLFDLYKTMSYGEIMIDFGLTSMEEAADPNEEGSNE